MKYPNIEAERARLGLNKREMCEALGVETVTYRCWQNGKNRMPLEAAVKLAEILNVPMDYLVKEGNEDAAHECWEDE